MKKSWHVLFYPHIIERGWDYYEARFVRELKQTGNIYEAVVEGSEAYDVQISMRNGNVESAFCSCPYAADGNYCKHMAAVMFRIEEGEPVVQDDNLTSKPPAVQEDLLDVISRIPEENLMPYLKRISNFRGGKEAANKIAAQWKQEYRRRSAMMDELSKAGF